MRPKIFLIDDDPSLVRLVEHHLSEEGFDVSSAADGAEAIAKLEAEEPNVIVLDLQLPDITGQELLARFQNEYPTVPVVVLTAQTDLDHVVECMRLGALDYVQKPFDGTRLATSVRNACKQGVLLARVEHLTEELRHGEGFESIVGESRATKRSIELFRRAAGSGVTVLLHGASGTGKEVAARAIHAESARRSGPFVPVNCGAIPEGLIETELFGHEKGAYTGAVSARAGCFERAEGGTLFLDEVGELRIDLQVRLLRVLQERVIQRIGGSKLQAIDVRVIAATNSDLRAAVREGLFREDLYYRLAVFPIALPTLRDREGDVVILAETFIRRFASQHGKRIDGMTDAARKALEAYHWPGNVRELENVIERAIILEDGDKVSLDSIPDEVAGRSANHAQHPSSSGAQPGSAEEPGRAGLPPFAEAAGPPGGGAGKTVEDILPLEVWERRAIKQALDITGWNVQEAASRLRVGRATIYRKIDRFGLRQKD